MDAEAVRPFDPTVSQDEVDRMFRKLRDTRLPEYPVVPDSGNTDDYGVSLDWARRLKKYWETEYDWSKAQKQISSWHHFKTKIEDVEIHFIHERARQPMSIPILLVHGWPGSFYEFSQVIDDLTNGSSDDSPAFDVVVVSLPGFTFSGPPPRRGWTLQDSARLFDRLVTDRLGYKTYAAQGGDWGHWVVRELGTDRYPACRAVHTNMCSSQPPVDESGWTERERWAEERTKWWLGKRYAEGMMGYAIEMRTHPQTLGIALNDSPVGVMMWVGQIYRELADPEHFADLQDRDFDDHLCTTISLYLLTPPSIMTSMLCYTENVRHEVYVPFNTDPKNRITVPMGVTSNKYDVAASSARAAATTGNLKWFTERDYCGHFMALEDPKGFVADMRDFLKQHYAKA